jgi:hypothetical protein
MTHTLHRFVFVSLVLLAACSRAQSPTSPSRTALQVDGPTAGALSSWAAQSQGVTIADWACLTQGIGCPLQLPTDMPPAEDAPGAPSNLAFQVSGTTVILTWSPPGGGGAVATYVLEAGTSAGQNNIVSVATGSTATTMTVIHVPAGTYFVRVRARNADGTSGPSNEVSIVVGRGGGPCPTPAAPPGFTATASGNTLTLTWGAVANATSYLIEAGTASGATNIIVFDTGSAMTTLTGNAPNGTYHLRVRARSACGTGAGSNEVVLIVGGSQPPPGSLSGFWRGTVTTVEPHRTTTDLIEVDFTHSGTRLTGLVRVKDATFDLTQNASDPARYDGTLFVPRDIVGCENRQGSLTAQGTTRLSGTFTVSCGTNTFDITKVQ